MPRVDKACNEREPTSVSSTYHSVCVCVCVCVIVCVGILELTFGKLFLNLAPFSIPKFSHFLLKTGTKCLGHVPALRRALHTPTTRLDNFASCTILETSTLDTSIIIINKIRQSIIELKQLINSAHKNTEGHKVQDREWYLSPRRRNVSPPPFEFKLGARSPPSNGGCVNSSNLAPCHRHLPAAARTNDGGGGA